MDTKLSVKACLSYGWRTFKSRPWLFVQAGLVLLAINVVIGIFQHGIERAGEMGGDVVSTTVIVFSTAIGIALGMLITMGETFFFLRAHDDVRTARLQDLWHPRPFWKFLGASILAGILIVIGFILLIVPGIIACILFSFIAYLVIEKDLDPFEALAASVKLTKGNRFKLFLLGLAALGINLLGLLALGIGMLVTIPLTYLAAVHAYRTLSNATPTPSLSV